ncbi:Vezatin [Frankliniella fusca]|uniref:Vezatin n=1 Tax=Frankliniella fusca TaxID=407009 RepID=A0AAE1I450_9NEOP|nr:Vezatin [Frankliniella fusca]
MAEDEEIVRKGSVLYNYLQDNGFSNFESYELESQRTMFPIQINKTFSTSNVPRKAPQWTTSNLNCILKSGLILEDHRHFIEQYYPLETDEYSKSKFNVRLYVVPLLCLGGGLWRLAQTPVSKVLLAASAGIGSLYVAYRVKEHWRQKYFSDLTALLKLTLGSFEKLFVQYKKMLHLIHQNDFISQNTSLCQREMFELQKKLQISLLGTIRTMSRFLDGMKKIPLSVEVNVVLLSPSFEDMYISLNINDEEGCSYENLKKIFNSYILVQSEFLRRFALCHCPDVWNEYTSQRILHYSQNVLPEIISWTSNVHRSLIQELKLFKAVIECKNKGSQLRAPSSSSWEHSDLYVSVRSACVHFQSLLIQTQGLQEILENSYSAPPRNSEDLLNAAAQILTEISREIQLGQVCVDASLAQILKKSHPCETFIKSSNLDNVTLTVDYPDQSINAADNPPVQDEIFEFTVHHDESDCSDEVEGNNMFSEYSFKKKSADTSKIVLEELKTVLVKKAEEWKKREKKAMENKGIPYTEPMQVDSSDVVKVKEDAKISHSEELLDFLPTNNQSNWPLPRLKGNLRTHRSFKYKRLEEVESNPLKPIECTDSTAPGNISSNNTKLGFGASLLAEAMAKSRTMHTAREEEIFHDSESESSSAD